MKGLCGGAEETGGWWLNSSCEMNAMEILRCPVIFFSKAIVFESYFGLLFFSFNYMLCTELSCFNKSSVCS